jgi:adenosylmethionine-8-amino-7-oxononanoate aminotransferase
MTSFWHPFADMAAVEAGGGPSIVRGRGSHIWDDTGNRYLDSTAGLWFCNVGHGRAEIAEAARRQMAELASYSTFAI